MFDHTADLGVEVFGRTKKDLFAHAAWALTDIMMDRRESKSVQGRKKQITVEGADIADLLVNYLRELLYLFNGDHLVIQTCDILACSKHRLVAKLEMEPYNKKKHTIKAELKAVTYHGLSVEKEKTGWKARIIFDV
jgi:SHS2 domain-containing protein